MSKFYLSPIRSHREAKRRNEANRGPGRGNWYGAEEMRFFRSRLHSEPDRFGLFLHSSSMGEFSDGTKAPRHYAVGQVMPDGSVETPDGAGMTDNLTREEAEERLAEIRAAFERIHSDPAILERIASASPADQGWNQGHFGNTVFVDGPAVDSGLGPSSLYQFAVSRCGKADGAAVDGAIYHKGALVAYEPETAAAK